MNLNNLSLSLIGKLKAMTCIEQWTLVYCRLFKPPLSIFQHPLAHFYLFLSIYRLAIIFKKWQEKGSETRIQLGKALRFVGLLQQEIIGIKAGSSSKKLLHIVIIFNLKRKGQVRKLKGPVERVHKGSNKIHVIVNFREVLTITTNRKNCGWQQIEKCFVQPSNFAFLYFTYTNRSWRGR